MAEETGDVRFGRAAFGGFNRRDVMNYIDKLQRFAARSGDPDAAAQIAQERDALERENRRLREENAQLRAQLNAEQTQRRQSDETACGADEDASFCATAEPASDADAKSLSMRDVDEMVQKYFG